MRVVIARGRPDRIPDDLWVANVLGATFQIDVLRAWRREDQLDENGRSATLPMVLWAQRATPSHASARGGLLLGMSLALLVVWASAPPSSSAPSFALALDLSHLAKATSLDCVGSGHNRYHDRWPLPLPSSGLAAGGVASHIRRLSSLLSFMCRAPTMRGPLFLRPQFVVVFVESVHPYFVVMLVISVATAVNLLLPPVACCCNLLSP